MINITKFLTEAKFPDFKISGIDKLNHPWHKDAEFLWINVVNNYYAYYSTEYIKMMANHPESDKISCEEILALKPGETYTGKNGNYVFRFK